MCEFCLKHGEGKKWYLQAKNYSDDLLSDLRRRKFIGDFMTGADVAQGVKRLEELDRVPKPIRGLIRRLISRRMKRIHYGQVLPIEDVERIFGMMNSIVRAPCICRHTTVGREMRYCYGFSLAPEGSEFVRIVEGLDKTFLGGPDSVGFETLSREQALDLFRAHEQEGLCHTVWTFRAPFIGGVCNCDRADCLAMRCTVTHGLTVMFRAE